jgi:outer membrane protein assembly factor BamD
MSCLLIEGMFGNGGRAGFGFTGTLVVKYGVFAPGRSGGAHHNRTALLKTAAIPGTHATMQVKHLLLIAILALHAACSSNEVLDENLSESELYQRAQEDLNNSSYTTAITKLKALESRYPFGRYAEQSQLELIYANYKNAEPEAARAAADRFIRLHPQHANVDYAYYVKGLASFDQDRGLLTRFLPLDMTKRDPGAARDSYNEFAQLTSRYPNSRYAPDAKQRMVYLRNLLAAYEVHVAHYYLTRQAYVAAANRGRFVVENFQGTPAVGDGLAVMVEAYQRLTLDDLAATSLETLKLNYPDHPSLVDGRFVPREEESDNRSWLAKATLGLIESDAPPPPSQSQASKDLTHQYEEALEQIPKDLKADHQNETEQTHKRSWFSYLSFGLFD